MIVPPIARSGPPGRKKRNRAMAGVSSAMVASSMSRIAGPRLRDPYRPAQTGFDRHGASWVLVATRRSAAVQAAVAPSLEIRVQPVEIGGVQAHLGRGRHPLVRSAVREDVE